MKLVGTVAKLALATSCGQAILLLVMPILARLYSPEDFGSFALFLSVSTITGIASTLRYSQAIILPERESDAASVFQLSLIIAVVSGVIAAGALAGTPTKWMKITEGYGWSIAVWLIPISMTLSGVQQTLYAVATRQREYGSMAKSKLIQSSGFALIAVAIASDAENKAMRLILANVASQALAIFVLRKSLSLIKRNAEIESWKNIWVMAKRYKSFAMMSLPAEIINSIANQMPIILLARHFDQAVVGMYSMTMRAISAPLAVISVAILDVFKERLARAYQTKDGAAALMRKTAQVLALIIVPLLAALYPFLPEMFEKIFGLEWKPAGSFAQILTPLLMLRFIISPLSYLLYVAERQAADLVWQIALLLTTAMAIEIGGASGSPEWTITLFAGAYVMMYMLYAIIIYKTCGKPRQ